MVRFCTERECRGESFESFFRDCIEKSTFSSRCDLDYLIAFRTKHIKCEAVINNFQE
nr:hypothetical protein B11C_110003 [Bartonella sp. 1-1C]